MLEFWSVINYIFVHWTKKLTLAETVKVGNPLYIVSGQSPILHFLLIIPLWQQWQSTRYVYAPSEGFRSIVWWWDDKNITLNRESDRCGCMIPTRWAWNCKGFQQPGLSQPGGPGGHMTPLFWQISLPYLNQGAHYAQHITTCPHWIFRPS